MTKKIKSSDTITNSIPFTKTCISVGKSQLLVFFIDKTPIVWERTVVDAKSRWEAATGALVALFCTVGTLNAPEQVRFVNCPVMLTLVPYLKFPGIY